MLNYIPELMKYSFGIFTRTATASVRTFHGHVKAVKDLSFSNDGRQFLSCGYDRQMKLWDTETGQCIKRFSNGKIPYVIRFHPDPDPCWDVRQKNHTGELN